MEKKKWIKILFAFCMILILSPVSTVFADEISESADIISAPKAVLHQIRVKQLER